MRAEAARYRQLMGAERESGAREVIGATTFVFDSVRASLGPDSGLVRVPTICWAYRRHTVHWIPLASVSLVPIPVPMGFDNELVIYAHDDATLNTWKIVSFAGSKNDVQASIAELMKRVPWAMFGFTADARAAMAIGRRQETAQEMEARRMGVLNDASTTAPKSDIVTAAGLEIERLHSLGRRHLD